jgi:hypothetical protein
MDSAGIAARLVRMVAHRFSEEERQQVLLTIHDARFQI